MAIDLTLCVVPTQIQAIFRKAVGNPAYAEWVAFVPAILQNPARPTWDSPEVQELKQDVAALKSFFHVTAATYFYDANRCTSTLDYLLETYAHKHQLALEPRPLWQGGDDPLPQELTGGQGIPLQLYGRASLTSICQFLKAVDPAELLALYNYEALQEASVYKPTRPENAEVLLAAFAGIRQLFEEANKDDNLLILKIKD